MNGVSDILEAECGLTRYSDWVLIDQQRIDSFADVTEDHQFIHVDPVRAAASPFGGTIAHGFLTLSMLARMIETADKPALPEARMAVNYGCERLRFVAPVPSGSRIRLASTLVGFEEKQPGQFQLSSDLVVEIEGGNKPALTATWLTRLFF